MVSSSVIPPKAKTMRRAALPTNHNRIHLKLHILIFFLLCRLSILRSAQVDTLKDSSQRYVVSKSLSIVSHKSNAKYKNPSRLFYDQCMITPGHAYLENSKMLGLWTNYLSLNYKLKRTTITAIKAKNPELTLSLLLTICGDVELNPGPRMQAKTPKPKDYYPCAFCEKPVLWTEKAVCCDACSMWHHMSCISLCSKDYSTLNRSNVSWCCCRCNEQSLLSFTFDENLLSQPNYYQPLADESIPLESLTVTRDSPLKTIPIPQMTSSPKYLPPNPITENLSIQDLPSADASPTHYDVPQDDGPQQDANNDSSESNLSIPPTNDKRNNFRILNINCQCIRGKLSELESFVDRTQPDIICCTETWLYGKKPGIDHEPDAFLDSELKLNNYRMYRNDRDIYGGGVFIAVNKTLTSVEQPGFVTNCEIAWAKITLQGRKDVMVGCFYMPHRNASDVKELESSLQLIASKKFRHIILCGDFNSPDINWEEHTIPAPTDGTEIPQRQVQQDLLDLTTNYCLTQCVSSSTRQLNTLDLYFTTNPSLATRCFTVPGISDHDIIITDSSFKPERQRFQKRQIWMFKRANWEGMKQNCSELSTEMETLSLEKDINKMWSHLKKTIEKSLSENVPQKTVCNRNSVPWMTHDLKKLIRRKNRLHKQAKETNDWKYYRKIQKKCKQEFRKAEYEYLNSKITKGLAENDQRPFWRYVKTKKQENCGIPPLIQNGDLKTDNKTKANILLNQFSSVFTKPTNHVNGEIPTMPKTNQRINQSINGIKVDENGVQKLLQKVKVSKACGPDNIPNIILKECSKELAPAVTKIFQTSLDTGNLPMDWKSANIAPIFKKGDKSKAENYRPVSLTSVLSKLLEHIVCKAMLSHFDKNHVLTKANHGFRSGFSCETQLVTTFDELARNQDNGDQTDVAILDFSKAFDTVPHDKLLHKLESYGIRGQLLKWIESFICNRTMRVIIDGQQSTEARVLSGVPQGTVLGPLLFLCHVNDIPDQVSSSVKLFADDCLLFRKIKSWSDHSMLQQDLDNLEKWAKSWGMKFNPKKCYIMSISPKQSSHYYSLCGTILKDVQSNPYLGLNFADNLSWRNHINITCKKANSALALIRRNLWHCPKEVRLTAYLSMVRPLLEYGATIWDPHHQCEIDQLERIQRQAARFIQRDYRSRKPGSVTGMLSNLSLKPLQQRRRELRLSLLFKINEGLLPSIPPAEHLRPAAQRRKIKPKKYDGFVTSNPMSKYETRNSRCLEIPSTRNPNGPYANSFFVKTVVDWNKLEDKAVMARSLENFKSLIN